jgi:hypothetical protein
LGGEVSDHQWRDILGVLKTRAGELDLAYLKKWAIELNVACTRARDHLLVTSVKPASEFLDDMRM